ncbi:hypothetical protein CANARDRAFT_215686, partial [[Candida] arabinofermentans NRRL YB-2248]
MRPPTDYTGVLLIDTRDPKKHPIKLNGEQKNLLKHVTTTILHAQNSKNAAVKEDTRLLSALICLLDLSTNTPQTANKLYLHYRYWQMAREGKLITNKGIYKRRYSSQKSSEISLIGMDNYKNVMCYMDSILVCLFYSCSSYDFLLDSHADENLSTELQSEVGELKIILRYIVNLMRGGEFIPSSIMKQLCMALSSLGCELTMSCKQQDALQLFEFLSECLSLPLLTIKLDIIHSGKLNISDDLRLIEERTLLISVPNNAPEVDQQPAIEEDKEHHTVVKNEQPPISLEECLNSYFNNSVVVRRHIQRRRTLETRELKESFTMTDTEKDAKDDISEYEKMGIVTNDISSSSDPTMRLEDPIYEDIEAAKTRISHIESMDAESGELSIAVSNSTLSASGSMLDKTQTQNSSYAKVSDRLEASRTRSSTIVSTLNSVQVNHPSKLTRRSSSISQNEVALPAWMFLQLLPYYTDPKIKLKPENHEEIYRRISRIRTVESFDGLTTKRNETPSQFDERYEGKRPVIPICLKKYIWDEKGHSQKLERKVVVPEVIKYPYFIAEDRSKPGFVDFKRTSDNVAPFGSFMLILESCVCHRGKSVNSGHYVSLSRKEPLNANATPKPDEKQWILFNDMLEKGEKSKEISFNEAMDTEDPYILFYRVVELDDDVVSEYSANYAASGDDRSTIKPPHGSKDRYWTVGDSDSNNSQSAILAARKASVVSEISALSLKSSTLVPTTNPSSIALNPPRSNNHVRHLGLGKSLSRSASTSRSRMRTSTDDEASPLDPTYIDIANLYYWYDVDANGDLQLPNDFNVKPHIGTPADEHNDITTDGGFLDKMNSKILSLKRSSVATIQSSQQPTTSSLSHIASSKGSSVVSFFADKTQQMNGTENHHLSRTISP